MTHREQLDAVLRHAVILGTLAILFIPAARGSTQWLGWLPLWLVGSRCRRWRWRACRAGDVRRPCAAVAAGARCRCATRPEWGFRHIGPMTVLC